MDFAGKDTSYIILITLTILGERYKQIKFFIVETSPLPICVHLRPKYSQQNPVFKHLQPAFSILHSFLLGQKDHVFSHIQYKRTCFTTIQHNQQYYCFIYFNFEILRENSRRQVFELNNNNFLPLSVNKIFYFIASHYLLFTRTSVFNNSKTTQLA